MGIDAIALETKLDLDGDIHFQTFRNARIGTEKEVHQTLLDAVKIQEDVKMIGQLPDYDDLRGIDLENGGGSATVPHRIYGGSPNRRG